MGTHYRDDLCDADADGAEVAKVFFEFPDGKDLQFCGSHADRYMDKLVLLGCDVLDTRQPIEPR